MTKAVFAFASLGLLLSACSMAPPYERPALPVAQTWPLAAPAATAAASPVSWRDLLTDPALQNTIKLALANNRDLRVATLNVAKARAQYGIERAGLFPSLDGTGAGSKSHTDTPNAITGKTKTESYSASLGASWQLDLFGRVQSLKNAAKQDFFAQTENRNAAEISLIAAVADAWLQLAADQDQLRLSQQTYDTQKDAFDIAGKQAQIGVLSDLDLNQIRTEMEQARANTAAAATAVDQDKAALTLLVGNAVPDNLLPDGLKPDMVAASIPVGLPSDVLLNRPDILAAEHNLKAYNADIGAARAAFFPSISLTGSAGSASTDLGHLFGSGTGVWSYGANLAVPIFAGGANLNNLRSAKVSRDIAVAQYEQAIQQAFSDVNQALAVRARIDERLDAESASADAAAQSLKLSQALYQVGSDSYLTLMTAQRTSYSAQQALITLQALKARNLVALYAALGDDATLK
ncbi:efflux transporter outer membrane subunit [Asticcacaulis sp. EMRT-3]|uniref:efflux transporter outer membrane subunit n=1 Tax=Asticcacaulis sp. EMRT-3 TaxID=3040349 RepID=UPI0024AFB8CD|nr:efflux transporter outer membrane subunit [Asticcacaulis sp. EMRT-3]MDI7776474.1 efflux transporter outer membrane subunit [Asticcacaulis sp. EMRT-3]